MSDYDDYDQHGEYIHTTKRKLRTPSDYGKREVIDALIETVTSLQEEVKDLRYRVEDLEKELGK